MMDTVTNAAEHEQHLKAVFDVCDPQNNGFITVERFVDLATEHFGADAINAEELTEIISLLDPQLDGKIHFTDFCRGVEKILEIQQVQFVEGVSPSKRSLDSRGRSHSLSHSPVQFWDDRRSEDDARSTGGLHGDKHDVIMAESSSTGTLIDVCNNDILMPTVTVRVHSPGNTASAPPVIENDIANGEANPAYGMEHFEDFGEAETESNMTYSSSHSAERGQPGFGGLHRSSSRSLKSQKYRNSQSGSANTSRRSSLSDNDIFGDIDGSFFELNEKVKNLEEQLIAISGSQSENDLRHLRLKDENQHLVGKVNTLEEQLKDVEVRSWEQRAAEQKRHIDLMAKQERALIREVEQLRIALGNAQNESSELKLDVDKYKSELERVRLDNKDLSYQLEDSREAYDLLKAENQDLELKLKTQVQEVSQERQVNGELLDELSKELEELRNYKIESERADRCRSPSFNELPSRYRELSGEVKQLKETNEELQAQILNHTVHEGQKLLRSNSTGPSIADEMGDLPREDLLQALREQEEVNRKLRDYVDRIILTILEKNPSLLEVKSMHSPS